MKVVQYNPLTSFVSPRSILATRSIHKTTEGSLIANLPAKEKKGNQEYLSFVKVEYIEALKGVLNRIGYLEHVTHYPTKVEEIGVAVYEVLLTNCYHESKAAEVIGQFAEARYSIAWHGEIIANPDIAEFVRDYLSSESSRPDIEIDRKSELDMHLKRKTSYLTYQVLLGTVYRKGGCDLVREMLNAHDPGASCPFYVREWQEDIKTWKMDVPFW